MLGALVLLSSKGAGLFPFLLRTLQLGSAPPAQQEAFLDDPASCPMLHPRHPAPLPGLGSGLLVCIVADTGTQAELKPTPDTALTLQGSAAHCRH